MIFCQFQFNLMLAILSDKKKYKKLTVLQCDRRVLGSNDNASNHGK